MAKPNSHHVTPHPDKGWAIKKDHSNHVIQRFDRKQDAIDRAREISRNQGTELVIHRKDGMILYTEIQIAHPVRFKLPTQ